MLHATPNPSAYNLHLTFLQLLLLSYLSIVKMTEYHNWFYIVNCNDSEINQNQTMKKGEDISYIEALDTKLICTTYDHVHAMLID